MAGLWQILGLPGKYAAVVLIQSVFNPIHHYGKWWGILFTLTSSSVALQILPPSFGLG